MMTLEQTILDQNDLENLCCDRPLKTKEIFSPNSFYGIDTIFKVYAGLSQDSSLKIVIPHGLSLSREFAWDAEVKADVSAIYYHSFHVRNAYSKALERLGKEKLLLPCASPFLYVKELLNHHPKPSVRKGTIFFPVHSTHHITAQMDYETLAAALTNLDIEYQPITICLYWRDFNLQRHLPFQKYGMRIVSAGHIYDPMFLFRFYHLCSTHHYAAGNGLGSHLFYAVKSGCSYFNFDVVDYSYNLENDVPRSKISTTLKSELDRLFQTPKLITDSEQMKTVDYHLGTQFLKSSEALRRELCQLESAYELEKNKLIFFTIQNPDIEKQLDEIPSETSPEERRLLYNFFSRVWSGHKNVLEIGSFLGGTSRAIALGMLANFKRQVDCKLYTYDRFQNYYSSENLIEYLNPLFEKGLLQEEIKKRLHASNSFLEIFQFLHADQVYSDLLKFEDKVLPGTPDESLKLGNLFHLPTNLEFDAIFIDGCKSWYGTKHFMSKVCQRTNVGTYFLFQDYGWYSCFWIPVFLQIFKHYFRLVSYVNSTYIFQLTHSLSLESIHQAFPDEIKSSDKALLDQLFSELLLAAQNRQDVRAMLMHTIQHGAALSYIGCLDEAKVKIASLLTQSWAQDYKNLIEAALKKPTYFADYQLITPINLCTDEEVSQIVQSLRTFQISQTETLNLRSQLQETQTQLNQTQDQLQRLHTHLQILHQQVQQTQTKLQYLRTQNRQTQKVLLHKKFQLKTLRKQTKKRLKYLRNRLGQVQERVAAMETSKFWKLRTFWFRLKQKLGIGKMR
jgi:hypothetical protein